VYLDQLSQASTGRYRCEVSGEGPMFATDSAYADLLVVVVPQNGPRITGLHKKRYSIGDSLELNCSSELTLPPANLTWYINQRPVPPEHLIKYPIVNKTLANEEKLHTAILGLKHKLQKSDLSHERGKGVLIKCVASIYDIYYKMVEERIQRERRRKILKTKKKNTDKNKYKYFLDKENDFQEDSQTEKRTDFFHINQTNKMECSVLVWIIAIFLIY